MLCVCPTNMAYRNSWRQCMAARFCAVVYQNHCAFRMIPTPDLQAKERAIIQDCILASRARTWYDSAQRGPLAQWQSTSLITTWFQVRILGGPPAVHLLDTHILARIWCGTGCGWFSRPPTATPAEHQPAPRAGLAAMWSRRLPARSRQLRPSIGRHEYPRRLISSLA